MMRAVSTRERFLAPWAMRWAPGAGPVCVWRPHRRANAHTRPRQTGTDMIAYDRTWSMVLKRKQIELPTPMCGCLATCDYSCRPGDKQY
jgi:hypothetical protein